jgi:hypothetical protein
MKAALLPIGCNELFGRPSPERAAQHDAFVLRHI